MVDSTPSTLWSAGPPSLAVLTTAERDTWARAREELMAKKGDSDKEAANAERRARRLQLDLACSQQELSHKERLLSESEARVAELTSRLEDTQAENMELRHTMSGSGELQQLRLRVKEMDESQALTLPSPS